MNNKYRCAGVFGPLTERADAVELNPQGDLGEAVRPHSRPACSRSVHGCEAWIVLSDALSRVSLQAISGSLSPSLCCDSHSALGRIIFLMGIATE